MTLKVEYKCLIILLLNSKFILLTGSLKLLRIFANCFKDISNEFLGYLKIFFIKNIMNMNGTALLHIQIISLIKCN